MKVLSSIIIISGLALSAGTAFAQKTDTPPPRDGAYDEITVQDKGIIPYTYIREADVTWRKRIWRAIDTREKMNLPFTYPKQPLISILRDAAIEGTLAVYDGIDDEFKKRMTNDEVKNIGVGGTDTTVVIDPVTGEESRTVVQAQFDPLKVKKYRIKEDWIVDKQTSTMVVRILGIAPVMEVVDAQGNVRGDQVLFWVYYPEARPILAKYSVFNPKNDAQKRSWEDVFESRYFESYIIKVSNVYDRRIQDYAVGVDALYEAEKIRNEIQEYESQLWQY